MRIIVPALVALLFALDPGACWSAPVVTLTWGTFGSGPGQFSYPYGIAVSPSGAVYVSDQYNYRIQKFSSNGDFLTAWGSQGSGPGQFHLTIGLAVDSHGNVYVSDYYNSRVQVFSSDGAFLRLWGTRGSGAGQFHGPRDVAIDASGLVHVADYGNGRVQMFTSNGNYVGQWGTGLLVQPTSLTFDASGFAYVAEEEHSYNRVSKWDPLHARIMTWGITGRAPGQFYGPSGVAVNADGSVFVADFSNNRVQVFASDGTFRELWGGPSGGPVQFSGPADVAIDAVGAIYVIELHGNRVQKLIADAVTVTTRATWGAVKARYR